jgi:hypothetical protein
MTNLAYLFIQKAEKPTEKGPLVQILTFPGEFAETKIKSNLLIFQNRLYNKSGILEGRQIKC